MEQRIQAEVGTKNREIEDGSVERIPQLRGWI
jgi:hypothetical protein